MKIENPEEALSHIRQLVAHPGWALLCARFKAGHDQLKDSVFDMKLDDETANRIRHAAAAVETFDPATLAKQIDAKLVAAAKKNAPEPS